MRKAYQFILLILFGIGSCNNPSLNNHESNIPEKEKNKNPIIENEFNHNFFGGIINKFDTNSIPVNWYKIVRAQHRNEQILIWKHYKDSIGGREWKECIILRKYLDSNGLENYCISDSISDQQPFEKYHINSISYAPKSNKPNEIGYYYSMYECFKEKPSEKEIYELLYRKFKFDFATPRYLTVEAGIDIKSWEKLFGFKPKWLYLPN